MIYHFFQASASEWRNVFYVCAGFDMVGTVIFAVFASGELQVNYAWKISYF
jgi:hypothetical protein